MDMHSSRLFTSGHPGVQYLDFWRTTDIQHHGNYGLRLHVGQLFFRGHICGGILRAHKLKLGKFCARGDEAESQSCTGQDLEDENSSACIN